MQDPSNGKNNGCTYALVGSSGAGKSTLLRKVFFEDIYSDFKTYLVTVFTESPQSDALQGLEKLKILVDKNGLDEDLINLMYKFNRKFDKIFNFVCVLDDCIHLRYMKQIEKMFLIMRNTNITSVVSLQYPKLIPPSIRTSVYFVFCMRLNFRDSIEQFVRGFLWGYLEGRNIEEKILFYQQWTEDYQFFLLDNLNHKCYKVDKDYNCVEQPLIHLSSAGAKAGEKTLVATPALSDPSQPSVTSDEVSSMEE